MSRSRLSSQLTIPDSNSVALLRELRAAWNIPDSSALVVIGTLRARMRDDGSGVLFLNHLAHPETGVGLVYPGETRSASAFVRSSARAHLHLAATASDNIWAIGELELSPQAEREKHGNPWRCNVKPGTLRLLTELPEDWHVTIHGSAPVRLIAESARDAIEVSVRERIMAEDQELAVLDAQQRAIRAQITAELDREESQYRERCRQFEERIEDAQRRSEAAKVKAEEWEAQLQAKIAYFEYYTQKVEQETSVMEGKYRQLSKLASEKGARLVALGLIDEDDLNLLLGKEKTDDLEPRVGLAGTLDGDFSRLAPLIQVKLARSGLMYSQAQLRNYLALLRTRDLVVLAGDSGTGKTSLVKAVAEAIGGRATIVPVKPNWTGPEDLLGFFNPLERRYHTTQFLQALQAAAREPHVPHFICLDEMNLARVEHYFADFLSLLENRRSVPEIPLYSVDEERHVVVDQALFLELVSEACARAGLSGDVAFEDILKNDRASEALHRLGGFKDTESALLHHGRLRRSLSAQVRTPTILKFPENVWVIGSVNMDETTHHLSPKVLDRVHVLRFHNPMLTDWDRIELELANVRESPEITLHLSPLDFGPREDYPVFDRHDVNTAFLRKLAAKQLDPLGIEFGMRAIRQCSNYLKAAEAAGLTEPIALDNVVKQKILPKIALDVNRPASDGRKRRDILIELRSELAARFRQLEFNDPENSSVSELDRLLALADSNHGIANYWAR